MISGSNYENFVISGPVNYLEGTVHHFVYPFYLSARRRVIRVLAGAAVPALLLGALAVSPAAASSEPTCGSTLTTDTVLTSDLNCPAGDGLVIGASGITLDLGGHTLSGSGGDSMGVADIGLAESITGVTIRNGTIADFGYGIYLEDTQNTTISHVRLINDAAGLSGEFQGAIVAFVASYGVHVDHCVITGGGRLGGAGRAIWASGGDMTVEHTTVSGGPGVLVADGAMTLAHDAVTDAPINTSEAGGVTITHSVLTRSPINAGFEDFVFTTITDNRIIGATTGVEITYPSINATISGNVFRNDTIGVMSSGPLQTISTTTITGNTFVGDGAAGILLETTGTSTRPLMISGNKFTRNGFNSGDLTDSAGHPVMDGLHVDSAPGSDIVITGNTTRLNAAYGIYAQPGTVVDGGGNTSAGNPDGCLGVSCG